MDNLCWPCHKIGQGHPRVMIYINFVELLSLMLHAKLPSGSGEDFYRLFAIYSHGGHLGHVTLTIYINFHSPSLRIFNKTFGFDWPFQRKRKRPLNIMVIYMHIAPRWGQTCPWGPFFQNHKYSVY